MIKDLKLNTTLIYAICTIQHLNMHSQLFSNNCKYKFINQNVLTIYPYIKHTKQRLKIKQIHHFTNDYLPSWFPFLPCDEVFRHLARASFPGNRLTDC